MTFHFSGCLISRSLTIAFSAVVYVTTSGDFNFLRPSISSNIIVFSATVRGFLMLTRTLALDVHDDPCSNVFLHFMLFVLDSVVNPLFQWRANCPSKIASLAGLGQFGCCGISLTPRGELQGSLPRTLDLTVLVRRVLTVIVAFVHVKSYMKACSRSAVLHMHYEQSQTHHVA